MKRPPWARQGPATAAGRRAPLGTVGRPGPAGPGRPHRCGARARSAAARPARRRPPQRRLTCSCGTGGLRACPPRTARACNLREDGGRAQARSAQASGAAAAVWERRAPCEAPQARPLTQIEDRQLREPRHGGQARLSSRLQAAPPALEKRRLERRRAGLRPSAWRPRKSAF